MKKIKMEELAQSFQLLMDCLKEFKIHELEVDKDFYWVVDEEFLFEFGTVTTPLNIGSFFDDVERLKKCLDSQEFLFIDIKTLSNILKFLYLHLTTKGE